MKMYMCVVPIGLVDLGKLNRLNGDAFKTCADARNAVVQCAYSDLQTDDPDYERDLLERQAELEKTFMWYESMEVLAADLNGFDSDSFAANHAFIALGWERTRFTVEARVIFDVAIEVEAFDADEAERIAMHVFNPKIDDGCIDHTDDRIKEVTIDNAYGNKYVHQSNCGVRQ